MKPALGKFQTQTHRIKLPNGYSTVVVRPIRPDDGPRLAKALRQLSPESRRRRFLFSRGSYTAAELDYFTHCDGVDHLALAAVAIDPKGREHQFVAVARSLRDSTDLRLAEVAIAVADDWQHHGVGEILIQELARNAWTSGIRNWNATLFTDNVAMRKLMNLVGKKLLEKSEDGGVIGIVYELSPTGLKQHE